jgi:hypothetical protein
MDIVVSLQHRQDLPLRVIGCPLTDALGSCGGCYTGFNAYVEFQRMNGMDASFPWFIEAPPHVHGAKECRHSATMFCTSTIDPALKVRTRRGLFGVLGLHMMQDPRHNTSANLPQQRTERLSEN